MPAPLCELALAAHARTEARIAVICAAHLLDQTHHVVGALRHMPIKPLAEQFPEFMGRADCCAAGVRRTRASRFLQDLIDTAISHYRNDRRNQHAARHASRMQTRDRFDAQVWDARARLEGAGEAVIE